MIVGRVASSVVRRHVKYVNPVPTTEASGLVAQTYAQIADEMRLVVTPALPHSIVPELLAAYWMLSREPLLPTTVVDRSVKEAVAATVSVANICPYCVDMHSVGLYDLAGEPDAEAVVADRVEELADDQLRLAARWARSAHTADPPPFPFDEPARPELVGVVVGFHYISRMVNVFLANFLLPPGLNPRARRRLKRGISRVLHPTLHDPREPGRSVPLLPHAPLPASAGWAAGNPHVAAATGRAYAAFEAAGERALSPVVRNLVGERLAAWHGEDTGLSRRWCELLVDGLPEADRAAGRLALLTAFASHQVDEEVIGEFRRHRPDDRSLVEAVAWASFAVAQEVGARHVAAGPAGPEHGRRRGTDGPTRSLGRHSCPVTRG
ncbi:carboxymuconolactone decarboxylase family protein [Micromonospora sp. RB23]